MSLNKCDEGALGCPVEAAMWAAIKTRDAKALSELLAARPALALVLDPGGNSPIVVAAKRRSASCVKLLARESSAPKLNACLVISAELGDLATLKALTEMVAQPALGRALRAAAVAGKARCVAFLAPLCDVAKDWPSALAQACSTGKAECASLLLDGVGEGAIFRGLELAALGGHLPCVKALASASRGGEAHSRALMLAARLGDAECLEILLEFSDSKQARSDALAWAARCGAEDCVRMLIPVSDPLACSSAALRSAAACGHEGCLRLLIPVSEARACESYALKVAASNGHLSCVKALVEVSDVSLDGGYTALGFSQKAGHEHIAEFLKGWAFSDSERKDIIKALNELGKSGAPDCAPAAGASSARRRL